jgi:hypothetical protein
VKPELPRALKNSKVVSPVSSHFESTPFILRQEFQKSRFSGTKIEESGMNFLMQTRMKICIQKKHQEACFP